MIKPTAAHRRRCAPIARTEHDQRSILIRELAARGESPANMMLVTGLSRRQLERIAREHRGDRPAGPDDIGQVGRELPTDSGILDWVQGLQGDRRRRGRPLPSRAEPVWTDED